MKKKNMFVKESVLPFGATSYGSYVKLCDFNKIIGMKINQYICPSIRGWSRDSTKPTIVELSTDAKVSTIS